MSRISPIGLDPDLDAIITTEPSSTEGLLAASEVSELRKAAAAQYSKQAHFNFKIEKRGTKHKDMGWIG